ncbi:MAG: CehA/McbA family metallohydrolase [Candidatus Cloacimonetes bacterium]|nr:CehA/McbA family metallohydrolase [Candidatus Cloacimonadota bacterium]
MNIFQNLQGLDFLEGFFSSAPFLISYAEIHFHLKYLYPKYYRKEPEIITDIPIRVIKNQAETFPLLIIVKDADLFPITIKSIEVHIESTDLKISQIFVKRMDINLKYFSKIINVNIGEIEADQYLKVVAKLNVEIGSKSKIIINDNLPDIPPKPYKIFYAKESLLLPENWYAGEPHYHSIHTADQVEFGADIKSTAELANAMGLSWLFVTDHSYDLDDSVTSCIKNDADLPIWKQMRKDVKECDTKEFRIIPGEEVSIGNSKGENVHMLAINHNKFIEGHGDSAEKWFKNKPQHSLSEIKKLHEEHNLFIAAHPVENIPFLQKLTLRRGNWSNEDYIDSGINFLQVINSAEPYDIKRSIGSWKELLLNGNRYYLIAGNDAHGNFNVMRQIKSPFWKLFSSKKQVFGQFFTAYKHKENQPVAGLKNGEVIVSNGPFLSFQLKIRNKLFPIGSSCKTGKATLIFAKSTSTEFGKISNISVYTGDYSTLKEIKIEDPENNCEIELPKMGYVRMSLETEKSGVVFTNPVWIG